MTRFPRQIGPNTGYEGVMNRASSGIMATLFTMVFCTETVLAQDGGQLYGTYCGACHGTNGEGATGGQFPPLAGSEWVEGAPERAIQTVLHGLQGPIEVAGSPYNLIMPPQGAAIPDDQLAAILTFVRSSWGNREDKVSPEMIAKARASSAGRTTPWTAPELLKLYPLPKQETLLENLTSQTYLGKWKRLPDFSKLEAENIEEEHDGIISVRQSGRAEHFAMVWEADFVAPKSGAYPIHFACDDGGRLILNGEVLMEVHGIGPMSPGRTQGAIVKLKKGRHPIRVEYHQAAGPAGIVLSVNAPNGKSYDLTDNKANGTLRKPASVPLEPTGNHTATFRNFIEGTTPRAIGFGFPAGVNLAYSADHFAPELLWNGDFIDAGKMWNSRGMGRQRPSGENIIRPTSMAVLPEGTRAKGYRLDPNGNPTFRSHYGKLVIDDGFTAEAGKLIRTIKVSGSGDPIPIILVDNALNFQTKGKARSSISPDKSTIMDVDTVVRIDIPGGASMSIESPRLKRRNSRYSIILGPGQTKTITYHIK